jgi:hypothetical protein
VTRIFNLRKRITQAPGGVRARKRKIAHASAAVAYSGNRFDRKRNAPLVRLSDQERLPFALNEAIAETLFGRLQAATRMA